MSISPLAFISFIALIVILGLAGVTGVNSPGGVTLLFLLFAPTWVGALILIDYLQRRKR